MSLTKEQKKDLHQLSEYFKKIEQLAIENNLDLDVFMTEYQENGFAFYKTEKIGHGRNSGKRKAVFENAAKEKELPVVKNH